LFGTAQRTREDWLRPALATTPVGEPGIVGATTSNGSSTIYKVIDPSLVAVPNGVGTPLRIPYPTIPFLMAGFTAVTTKGEVAIGSEPSFVFIQPTTKFKR
jgi:hypothetical protein